MKVPTGSAKGPKVSGFGKPSTSLNQLGGRVDVGHGDADVVDAEQTGHLRDDRVEPVALRRPERLHARYLIRHPVRVADQLDVGAERRLEVVDRLAGGRAGGQLEGAEELLDVPRLHVRDRFLDVGHVERDVVTRPVGVRGWVWFWSGASYWNSSMLAL